MDTWVWILIIVGVVLILAGLAYFMTRDRREGRKREEADGLRHQAEDRRAEAGRREAVAEAEAERARREREASDEALHRADEVDPDVR
jgi:flagellar biosynthesis/type III secretory pathway M-ring protein FliF/YscJ